MEGPPPMGGAPPISICGPPIGEKPVLPDARLGAATRAAGGGMAAPDAIMPAAPAIAAIAEVPCC